MLITTMINLGGRNQQYDDAQSFNIEYELQASRILYVCCVKSNISPNTVVNPRSIP